MSSEWDEIRQLASDLERVQSSVSAQRLSESNCIEIVNKLIKSKLIELQYTLDGKEYVTHDQLQREMLNELYVANNRIHLNALVTLINVDYSCLEHQAQMMTKLDPTLKLVLGQLMNAVYFDTMAEEINEQLQFNGTLTLASIIKQYDLPPDLVEEEITKRLGNIIEGHRDVHNNKCLVTNGYVRRIKAKVVGALSAVTRPTNISSLNASLNIPEPEMVSIIHELLKLGRIQGSLGRSNVYIPTVYTRSQERFVDHFFTSNNYIDYETVARLGVPTSEIKSFLMKRLSTENTVYLKSSCVDKQLINGVESALEEALSTDASVDVVNLLPSALSKEDCSMIIDKTLKSNSRLKDGKGYRVVADSVFVSQGVIKTLETKLDSMVHDLGRKDLKDKKYDKLLTSIVTGQNKFDNDKYDNDNDDDDKDNNKRGERRKKAAAGKGGGGTQGRETKTKSTKKKTFSNKKANVTHDNSEDDGEDDLSTNKSSKNKKGETKEPQKIVFMRRAQLAKTIVDLDELKLEERQEEVAEALASEMESILNAKLKQVILDMYQSNLLSSSHDRRKAHNELQEGCANLVNMIRLYEKGLQCFDENNEQRETRVSLERHLLKTLCTDLVNMVCVYVDKESKGNDIEPKDQSNQDSPVSNLSHEQRHKIAITAPKSVGEAITKMNSCLVNSDVKGVENFLDVFESCVGDTCEVYIKKSDKKKDRQLIFHHRQTLLEQLNCSNEHAKTLHLAVLILFQNNFNALLHISGKFVPSIIDKLSSKLEENNVEALRRFQRAICDDTTEEDMDDLAKMVRDVVSSAKKNVAKEE